MKGIISAITALVGRVLALRLVRVFFFYLQKNGSILASGLSLTALYSVFAALYVGFAILGIYIQSDPQFKDAVISTVSTSVPGLIKSGGSRGAIDLDSLFASRVLTWSSIVALVVVLLTALNWIASARAAVRTLFELPADTTFFLILKVKDLGLALAFAVVTLASAALSVFSTSALSFLFGVVGIDSRSLVATLLARVVGLVIVLAIDTTVLAVLFRVLVATRIPLRRLIHGALIGGIGLGVLKALGATIVGGVNKNPLLASFAIILGLLVWFGLACQVILLSAAWIAVGLKDRGVTLQPPASTKSVRAAPEHSRPRTRAVSPPG